MGRLRRFCRRTAGERRLLMKTWLLVAGIRLGLAALPFSTVLRWIERFARGGMAPSPSGSHADAARRLAWSIEIACRYVPWANTCLVKALAMQALLARRGWPAELRLGACRDGDSRLRAHAWVESNGSVVIGGARTERVSVSPPPVKLKPESVGEGKSVDLRGSRLI